MEQSNRKFVIRRAPRTESWTTWRTPGDSPRWKRSGGVEREVTETWDEFAFLAGWARRHRLHLHLRAPPPGERVSACRDRSVRAEYSRASSRSSSRVTAMRGPSRISRARRSWPATRSARPYLRRHDRGDARTWTSGSRASVGEPAATTSSRCPRRARDQPVARRSAAMLPRCVCTPSLAASTCARGSCAGLVRQEVGCLYMSRRGSCPATRPDGEHLRRAPRSGTTITPTRCPSSFAMWEEGLKAAETRTRTRWSGLPRALAVEDERRHPLSRRVPPRARVLWSRPPTSTRPGPRTRSRCSRPPRESASRGRRTTEPTNEVFSPEMVRGAGARRLESRPA